MDIDGASCVAAVDVGMTRFVDGCGVGSTIVTVNSVKGIDDGLSVGDCNLLLDLCLHLVMMKCGCCC